MHGTTRRFHPPSLSCLIASSLFPLALQGALASPARAGQSPAGETVAKKGGPTSTFESIGLPRYIPPASYQEDLVVNTEGTTLTMRRFVDHERIRTEISVEGQQMVTLEMGDAKGTVYSLMPQEKRAMKQSRQAMAEASAKAGEKTKPEPAEQKEPPSDYLVEDLGDETIDGTAAKKVRMSYDKEGDVIGWFDKGTGAPLRMETIADGRKAAIEWKNRKAESPPADLFVVPKGYEVVDMDQMMAQMGGMGAMAGGMAQGMGQSLGSSLGGALGGSLGGPLGAAAGQFIGGKIGGMLGKKASNAIVH